MRNFTEAVKKGDLTPSFFSSEKLARFSRLTQCVRVLWLGVRRGVRRIGWNCGSTASNVLYVSDFHNRLWSLLQLGTEKIREKLEVSQVWSSLNMSSGRCRVWSREAMGRKPILVASIRPAGSLKKDYSLNFILPFNKKSIFLRLPISSSPLHTFTFPKNCAMLWQNKMSKIRLCRGRAGTCDSTIVIVNVSTCNSFSILAVKGWKLLFTFRAGL